MKTTKQNRTYRIDWQDMSGIVRKSYIKATSRLEAIQKLCDEVRVGNIL